MKNHKGLARKNFKQKFGGFTLIEALLILVIVGLLGGTSWYVWEVHNKTTDAFINADAANSSVAKYPTHDIAIDPQTKAEYARGHILVAFNPDVLQEPAVALIKGLGLKYELIHADPKLLYSITVPQGKEKDYVKLFSQKTEINYAELDYVAHAL